MFVRLREMLETNEDIRNKIAELENKYDNNFRIVFELIDKLVIEDEVSGDTIGFKLG